MLSQIEAVDYSSWISSSSQFSKMKKELKALNKLVTEDWKSIKDSDYLRSYTAGLGSRDIPDPSVITNAAPAINKGRLTANQAIMAYTISTSSPRQSKTQIIQR